MGFTLVELLTMDTLEMAERIDGGEVITSTLVKKAINLLKAQIAQVRGIGMSKAENDKQTVEYERKEDALQQRLYFLSQMYSDLKAEEDGETSEKIFFIPREEDSDMTP